MVDFKLDVSKSERLKEAMSQIAPLSEKLTNDVLKAKGTKKMIQAIVGFMPISRSKKARHAKTSNSLAFRMGNLGFTIYARGGAANKAGSFGYLVFPNEGRGPRNPIAQRFFERGADSANEQILDDVISALQEAHKSLGGN